MSFGTYTTGFLIVIAGLIYGTSLMHVPTFWIVVGWIMLAGQALLILRAATRKEGLDVGARYERDLSPMPVSRIEADTSETGLAFPKKVEAAEGPTQRA